jgi:hypothetical protein
MNKETAVSEEQEMIKAQTEMQKAITALRLELPPEIVDDVQGRYLNLLKAIAGRRQDKQIAEDDEKLLAGAVIDLGELYKYIGTSDKVNREYMIQLVHNAKKAIAGYLSRFNSGQSESSDASAWPLNDVLKYLIRGTEILLHKKDYDGLDYEEMNICVKRAKEIIESKDAPTDECTCTYNMANVIVEVSFDCPIHNKKTKPTYEQPTVEEAEKYFNENLPEKLLFEIMVDFARRYSGKDAGQQIDKT